MCCGCGYLIVNLLYPGGSCKQNKLCAQERPEEADREADERAPERQRRRRGRRAEAAAVAARRQRAAAGRDRVRRRAVARLF